MTIHFLEYRFTIQQKQEGSVDTWQIVWVILSDRHETRFFFLKKKFIFECRAVVNPLNVYYAGSIFVLRVEGCRGMIVLEKLARLETDNAGR